MTANKKHKFTNVMLWLEPNNVCSTKSKTWKLVKLIQSPINVKVNRERETAQGTTYFLK